MNNLNLPEVAPNQNQKEVTINDQAFALDAAFSNVLVVDLSAASHALTLVEFTRNVCFIVQGNAVARTLTAYPGVKRQFTVINSGSDDLTVLTGSGSVLVPAGNAAVLHTDGDNLWQASSGPSAPAGINDVDSADPSVRVSDAWLKLIEGDGISFDDSTPGELRVSGETLPDMENNAGKILSVNDEEDGAEWVDPPAGGGDSLPSLDENAGKFLAVNENEDGIEWREPPSGGASLPGMTGNKGKVLAVNDDEDGAEWVEPAGGAGSNFLRVMASFSSNDTGNYATLANQFTLAKDKDLSGVFAAFNPQSVGAKYRGCVFEVDGSGKIIAAVAASAEFEAASTGLQEHLFPVSPAVKLDANTDYIMALVRTDGTGSSGCRAAAITTGAQSYSDSMLSFDSYLTAGITRRWYVNNDPYATSVSQSSSSGAGAYGIGLVFA
ncbi:hypothetical protein [Castellaniella sp.]|uniref:hypothetical protein n=1 Tax=Castellaniella sp. TaxID=1955812 RepID=UPI0035603848